MATKKPAPKAAKSSSSKIAVKKAPAKSAAKAKPVAKAPAKSASKPASAKSAKSSAKAVSARPVAQPAPKATVKPVPKATPIAQPAAKKTVQKEVKQDSKALPKKEQKPAAKPATPKEVKAKDIEVPAPKPVVIPKIATKTVRKYQPDFTKSVLDKPKNDPGAPVLRYSDNDLTEFRELIQRKLESAKKELSYLQGLITRKDEMGGDETDNRYMTMEDGSLSMEREQLSQMASRQITFIDHLEKALMRIENKTYGICRVTGKLIDKARLRAVPHATLSIEAKMGIIK
jgi:RNA polymerase-binding transcription factor DksA